MLYGQEQQTIGLQSKVAFSIALDASFNNDDFLLGIYPGILLKKQQIRANLFFYARPYEKKVYVRQTQNFLIRYLEWRSVLGINVDKHFEIYANTGLMLSAGYGWSFATYAGSNSDPKSKGTPVLKVGFDQRFADIFVGIGYKFIKLPYVDNNQFYLSFTY